MFLEPVEGESEQFPSLWATDCSLRLAEFVKEFFGADEPCLHLSFLIKGNVKLSAPW